jgi:hypothetical protein
LSRTKMDATFNAVIMGLMQVLVTPDL